MVEHFYIKLKFLDTHTHAHIDGGTYHRQARNIRGPNMAQEFNGHSLYYSDNLHLLS